MGVMFVWGMLWSAFVPCRDDVLLQQANLPKKCQTGVCDGQTTCINIYSVQNCFGSANFAKVKTQGACSVDFEVRLKFGWGQIELKIPLRWTVQDIQVLLVL